jgi:hypothetical protein
LFQGCLRPHFGAKRMSSRGCAKSAGEGGDQSTLTRCRSRNWGGAAYTAWRPQTPASCWSSPCAFGPCTSDAVLAHNVAGHKPAEQPFIAIRGDRHRLMRGESRFAESARSWSRACRHRHQQGCQGCGPGHRPRAVLPDSSVSIGPTSERRGSHLGDT